MSAMEHRPSAVLEMPGGHFWWCLGCSKPWPCPDAPAERIGHAAGPDVETRAEA